jgi:hypothetical protein
MYDRGHKGGSGALGDLGDPEPLPLTLVEASLVILAENVSLPTSKGFTIEPKKLVDFLLRCPSSEGLSLLGGG